MSSDLARLDLRDTGYCASFNFRRTARAVTRFYDDALPEAGMRSTQFAILVGIAKNQPVSMSKLGEILLIDPTTLTRSLGLLQKDGLVSVSKRSTMRQRFVTVTHKGQSSLARCVPVWRKTHARFVETVGTKYWLDLRAELERLAHVTMDLSDSAGKDSPPGNS